MVIVMLADGFEELEALTPVDILRRGGIDVKTVGVNSRIVIGSHGISVVADILPDEIPLSELDMVIFPGGMPGSTNLDKAEITDRVIAAAKANGARLAAICAAPLVLGHRGLLEGKRATCYPGFEGELYGASCVKENVVTDGYITTANGMEAAMEFAKELLSLLKK